MIAFNCLLSPLTTVASNIPLIGGLTGAVVSFGASIIAVTVATAVSCIIIAVAWFFVRPTLALALLSAAVIPFIFFRYHKAVNPAAAASAASGGGVGIGGGVGAPFSNAYNAPAPGYRLHDQ
jgi:hypothetical protein